MSNHDLMLWTTCPSWTTAPTLATLAFAFAPGTHVCSLLARMDGALPTYPNTCSLQLFFGVRGVPCNDRRPPRYTQGCLQPQCGEDERERARGLFTIHTTQQHDVYLSWLSTPLIDWPLRCQYLATLHAPRRRPRLRQEPYPGQLPRLVRCRPR